MNAASFLVPKIFLQLNTLTFWSVETTNYSSVKQYSQCCKATKELARCFQAFNFSGLLKSRASSDFSAQNQVQHYFARVTSVTVKKDIEKSGIFESEQWEMQHLRSLCPPPFPSITSVFLVAHHSLQSGWLIDVEKWCLLGKGGVRRGERWGRRKKFEAKHICGWVERNQRLNCAIGGFHLHTDFTETNSKSAS